VEVVEFPWLQGAASSRRVARRLGVVLISERLEVGDDAIDVVDR
jgi:hypothetical protein